MYIRETFKTHSWLWYVEDCGLILSHDKTTIWRWNDISVSFKDDTFTHTWDVLTDDEAFVEML